MCLLFESKQISRNCPISSGVLLVIANKYVMNRDLVIFVIKISFLMGFANFGNQVRRVMSAYVKGNFLLINAFSLVLRPTHISAKL